MTTLFNTFTKKEIANTIRQSFFLKQDAVVSDEMIQAFVDGYEQNNYQTFATYTKPLHTDQFAIHITHDIDWLNIQHPYSILKYVRSLVSNHKWFSLSQLFRKRELIHNIEQLVSLEKELGINALYCIGANKRLGLKRFDIRYGSNSFLFSELISLLDKHNQQIGLHSSFTACKNNSIAAEKERLESFTNKPVITHRSHYLHFDEQTLYKQLSSSNILYDFGNGKAQTIGLTNAFPGKRKPIHPGTGEVFNVISVPLMLMDNIFFTKPYHEVMSEFKQALYKLKQYNGSACILFHPENMLLKPQLWNYFEEIIHICKQEGAVLNPPL